MHRPPTSKLGKSLLATGLAIALTTASCQELRAVVTGALLGGVLGVSNLYVGLKAGWGMGVAITACVLSTALWRGLGRIGLSRDPMSVHEQNCM